MSKFAQAITAKLTGDVKACKMRYVTIEQQQLPTEPFALRNGVEIAAVFRQKAYIDDSPSRPKGECIVEALKDVRRAMVEEVFGEFRPYLIEMRAALHDGDESRLRRLLIDLEHKMFVEDVE